MIKKRTYASLTEALYECFRDHVDTEKESLLHDERYITKELKKFVGDKEYKKYDEHTSQQWHEAWRAFDTMTFKK